MRDQNHRIKNYNELRRPRAFPMANTSIFWLLCTFLTTLIFALAIYLADRLYWESGLYILLPFWVLLAEIFFIPGFFQLEIIRQLARDSHLNPEQPTRSIRVAYKRDMSRKRELVESVFGSTDPKDLADQLVQNWDWEKSIQSRIKLSRGMRTRRLLRLPSSAASLAYFSLIVSGMISFIIAIIQETDKFESLPRTLDLIRTTIYVSLDTWLIPFTALILLFPVFWSGLRNSALTVRETIDDDYLSEKSLFAFISQLIELHETKTPRLRLKTAGRVYWTTRILTSPLTQLGTVFKQAMKSGRIGKLRCKKR